MRPARLSALLLAALLDAPAFACDYPAGPPDAREARAAGRGVVSAIFTDATTIYGHGVLGDRIEASALRVRSNAHQRCPDHIVHLGGEAVFEDVTPRIADVTGEKLATVKSRMRYALAGLRRRLSDDLLTSPEGPRV